MFQRKRLLFFSALTLILILFFAYIFNNKNFPDSKTKLPPYNKNPIQHDSQKTQKFYLSQSAFQTANRRNYLSDTDEFPKLLKEIKNDIFIVIVSSQSENSKKLRKILRKTFLKDFKGSYKFYIGNQYCKIKDEYRLKVDKCPNCHCKVDPEKEKLLTSDSENSIIEIEEPNIELERQLLDLHMENQETNDLVLLDMIDTYQNLTLKVKMAFQDTIKNMNNRNPPKWIIKTDDDSILLVKKLYSLLTEVYPIEFYPYLYLGRMFNNKVLSSDTPGLDPSHFAKWGEEEYQGYVDDRNRKYYPTNARGPTYTLSYPLAKSLFEKNDQKKDLKTYICEDTSMAIWIDERDQNLVKKALETDKYDEYSINLLRNQKTVYVDDKIDGQRVCSALCTNNNKWKPDGAIFGSIFGWVNPHKVCKTLGDYRSSVYVLGHKLEAEFIESCYQRYLGDFYGL